MWTRIAIAAVGLALGGCLADDGTAPTTGTPVPESSRRPAVVVPVDREVVVEDLVFLREEEKLARDVYLTLGALVPVPVFANIAASEQTHMDAVLRLLQTYRIPDPVTDDAVGVFRNGMLAALYGSLVSAGEASDLAALTVGATIEDLDLHDIGAMASRNTAPDVARVYESLSCGSRNHLRAYVAQVVALGGTYDAQYITSQELSEILLSSQERCGR